MKTNELANTFAHMLIKASGVLLLIISFFCCLPIQSNDSPSSRLITKQYTIRYRNHFNKCNIKWGLGVVVGRVDNVKKTLWFHWKMKIKWFMHFALKKKCTVWWNDDMKRKKWTKALIWLVEDIFVMGV